MKVGTCGLEYTSSDKKKHEFKKYWISNNVVIEDDGLCEDSGSSSGMKTVILNTSMRSLDKIVSWNAREEKEQAFSVILHHNLL